MLREMICFNREPICFTHMIDSERLRVFYEAHHKNPQFLNEVDSRKRKSQRLFEDNILNRAQEVEHGIERK